MRMIVPVALALAVAACHNGRAAQLNRARAAYGMYGFRINMAGQGPIEGVLSVYSDTVLVEVFGQPCQRTIGPSPIPYLRQFKCVPPAGMDAFGITVNTDHPAQSDWLAFRNVAKTRTVCTRRQGASCAEWHDETYDEAVRSSGRLRLTPIATSD